MINDHCIYLEDEIDDPNQLEFAIEDNVFVVPACEMGD
jgi:hypothetical protein